MTAGRPEEKRRGTKEWQCTKSPVIVWNARLRRAVTVWHKPELSPRRHSGAGRNPVGYTSHSRKAGMTLKGGIGSVWHRRVETGSLLISRPALLGGLFLTPLYHLHPCRRGFQPALE